MAAGELAHLLLNRDELGRQLSGVQTLVHDPEPRDHCPVEELPNGCVSAQVEGVGVVAQRQQVFEELRSALGLQVVVVDEPFGLGDLASDASLFLAQQLLRDGVGVEGLQQLLPFALQRSDAALLRRDMLGGRAQLSLDLGHQLGPKGVNVDAREADAAPEVFDLLLDLGDADKGLVAGPALLAVEAVEVVVGDAVAIGRTLRKLSTASGSTLLSWFRLSSHGEVGKIRLRCRLVKNRPRQCRTS